MNEPVPIEQQKQWLIRKAANSARQAADRQEFAVLGPYFGDQVYQMLEQGALEIEDELCCENEYWFALHEADEVRKFLGFELVFEEAGVPSPDATKPYVVPDLEDLTPQPISVSEFDPETTGIVQHGADGQSVIRSVPSGNVGPREIAGQFPRVSVAKSLGYYDSKPTSMGVERNRLWAFLFFFCLGLAILGVIWVLLSLRV